MTLFYYKIKELILGNEKFLTKSCGSELSRVKQENMNTKFGWEEWKRAADEDDKKSGFVRIVTPEGKKIVNEYRRARGLEEIK